MSAIAVTGLGLVTALDRGVEGNWRRLLAGESGIRPITRFSTEGLRATFAGAVDHMGLAGQSAPRRTLAMAEAVATEALAAAGLAGAPFAAPLVIAAPPIEQEWPDRRRVASRAASPSYAAMLAVADEGPESAAHVDFLFGTVADRLHAQVGATGTPITVTTACASGATAIQIAVEAIRRGDADRVLVVGTDGSVHVEVLIRFALLAALSTHNAAPERAARPFAKDRDGFVMAEGAAALVLEAPGAAAARGARPLAYVRGCGEAADTFHRTRSNPDGGAIIRCIADAIADAGLTPDAIDHVNAHGTGTPENDKMECLALQAVFGERVARLPVTSNKSMIGHTLSAAGAIEAAVAILTLRDQILPPTINYREPDPALPLDVVANVARPARLRTVLSNSFGFGGQNVSLVLGLDPR